MADTYTPDVAAQIPAGGNPMTPTSGAYGEGAALDRLEAQLPGMQPGQESEVAPTPPSAGPPQMGAVGELPKGLFAPTRQPDVPVSTPLAQPDVFVGSGPERRIKLLESLVNNQEVSAETKEWAQLVLNHMRSVR